MADRKITMRRTVLFALAGVLVTTSTVAQERKPLTAADMQALLSKGLQVSSSDLKGGKEFTGRITLTADGKLTGTVTPTGDKAIPVSGIWKLKGAQPCRTLPPILDSHRRQGGHHSGRRQGR